jgi:glycosyltransferase involved in cell wall biosynthesis
MDGPQPLTFLVNSRDLRLALIIDYRWPRPDQDSGSLDAINLIDALLDTGFKVLFFADTESDQVNSYRLALEARGVLCLGPPRTMGLLQYLQEHGDQIQLCVLSRVFAGGNYLEEVQRYCTQAHIIFNPVDLHFLREERQAQLSGDANAAAAAARTRTQELLMFSEADATIVVSKAEQELLKRLDPRAHVVHLPLARPIVASQTPFEGRRGIGFVGGFEHAPNLDAVRFFLAEIWPLVREMVPGCEFSIVGKGLSEDLLRKLDPSICYVGHVPDIAAWLDTLRLTVAPLRFGAGAKGKIASSLACGVPCVATTVAVEGMGLENCGAVLLAETPAAFADHVRLAHTDATLWREMSKAGLTHAQEALSVACYRRGVVGMLEIMGLAMPDA